MAAAQDIDVVVFDLDGTLLDTETLSTRAIDRVLDAASPGARIGWELKARIVGMVDHEWAALVLAELGLADRLSTQELVDGWKRGMAETVAAAEVLPGAAGLVARLAARGVRMCVATSSTRGLVAVKRPPHEESLFRHFEDVITGDEVPNGKPAPDIFLLAARRMGADPARCLVFEDSPHGVTAARAAGMPAVAVPEARMDRSRFAHASLLLDSLEGFDDAARGRFRLLGTADRA